MFSEADEKLTDLEQRMLQAIEAEWTRWQEGPDKPLNLNLLAAMEKVHRAILARLGKRSGMNMAEMLRNPQAALLQLDRTRALLLRQAVSTPAAVEIHHRAHVNRAGAE
jgi:hypothetical protein